MTFPPSRTIHFLCAYFVFTCIFGQEAVSSVSASPPSSPCALVAANNGSLLYVAEQAAKRISVLSIPERKVIQQIEMPAPPTGLAFSPNESTLYVTCAAPEGTLVLVSTETCKIIKEVKAGFGACSPVVRSDGSRIYICNQYENSISVIDATRNKEIACVPVGREPISAVLSLNDAFLFIANQLPMGPSDRDVVATTIQVLSTGGLQIVDEIELPNGSMALKDLSISPDGKYIFATHILARFHMPTTQLERGWMNTNALSILDASERKLINTVLLDNVDRGAANPWGVTCTSDGKFACVTHAGTHELSLINIPGLLEKLEAVPRYRAASSGNTYTYSSPTTSIEDVPNDLTFLVDLRRRIQLPGNGPRAVVVIGNAAYVANYFSSDINVVPLSMDSRVQVETIQLQEETECNRIQEGEKLFHDATLCFQGWQSCSSCHPNARADALNWDLLNDGMGNPKNTKSLLLSHQTPPAMSLGVRADAETAVRAGIKHILFTVRPEEDAIAMDEYLKSLKPAPSPYLKKGKLQSSAKRGRKIFFSEEAGCASCHSGPYYTNLQTYDVGTKGHLDRKEIFDTPMLIELWRSGPYLHDGRAKTLRDVLTTCNTDDKHGKTSHLTESEIAELEDFLLSL